ncbi:MAG TPA: hypothetical protein VLV86_00080 [Vicinamibacterales bacterium]|nr:hypothetical protein [Vicinamibacterales bacterium]
MRKSVVARPPHTARRGWVRGGRAGWVRKNVAMDQQKLDAARRAFPFTFLSAVAMQELAAGGAAGSP